MNIARRDFAIFLVLAVFFTVYYSSGRCPGNYWDDSGEVITAGRFLGVLHPPGHPLYPVLARAAVVITGLPPESAVTLLSPLFMALSTALLYLVLVGFFPGGGLAGSAGAAGISFLTGFLSPLAVYGRIAEVYAAVLLFFLLFMLAGAGVIRARSASERRRWSLAALYAAVLGAGVHMLLFVVTAPLLLLWLACRCTGFPRRPRKNNRCTRDYQEYRNSPGSPPHPPSAENPIAAPAGFHMTGLVLFAAGITILGASIFLYLPLRGACGPALCWGDPAGFTGFLRHVLAVDFASELHGFSYASGAGPLEAAGACIDVLRGELGLALFFAAAGGAQVLLRPSVRGITLLSASATSLGAAALVGGGMVLDAYLLPALVVSVMFAYGLCFVSARCLNPPAGSFRGNRLRSLLYVLFPAVLAAGSAATRWDPCARAGVTGWDDIDFSGETRCSSYADLLLDRLVERRDGPSGMKRIPILLKTDNTIDYFGLTEGIARRGLEKIHVEYLPVAGVRFPADGNMGSAQSAGGGFEACPGEVYFTPRGWHVLPVDVSAMAGPFFRLTAEASAEENNDLSRSAGSAGSAGRGAAVIRETERDGKLLLDLDELLAGGNRHAVTRLCAIHGYRGAYFAAADRPLEALREYLIIAEKIDTTNAGAFFNAGQICVNKLDDADRAVPFFRKAVAIEPGNRIFLTALARNLLRVEEPQPMEDPAE